MNLYLPKTVEVDGKEQPIRYDFRVILEIIEMLNDPDLTNDEKAEALIDMFYVNPESIVNYRDAVEKCFRFIDNSKTKQKGPKLVDWEQDFDYIIAPINRVLGYESREVPYDLETNTGGLHWWTFMAAYMEIGSDCVFSQIVSIRDKRARGKKLEKHEREWMHRNIELVDIKQRYSEDEMSLMEEWTGKNHG